MSNVRVRFAPSPTGFFHIGSARTALFNWLYARHTGGTFILRIEDTDQARNSEQFLKLIYDSLTWLGLDWDEGPNANGVGERGNYGPYRQSQRGEIYQRYKQKLLDSGRAYEKDGAIWFKLLGERYKVFDDHRKKEVEKVKSAPVVIDDQIRGKVERQEDEDFVIFRSDGNPVFHFVNVVDDIEMKVSHIIRGEDHLSNTSKHVRLYEGFGVTAPVFAHIPLILKSPEMGQGKMSKRDKGALIEEYQQRHFLPEALVNYLSLLGWNPGDDREKMPVAEIVKLFDLPAVNQSNAKFDGRKLANMNMTYLLEQPADRFVALAKNFFAQQPNGAAVMANEAYFREIMLLAQPKIKSIDELGAYTGYFFTEDFPIDAKVKEKVMAKGDPKARLAELIAALPAMDFSTDATVEAGIKSLAEGKGLGFGDYQAGARLAVSGTNAGPSITAMFRVLGKERVTARLQRFLASV
ncbi:glutamate--tRNA ligase family protein [Opitutus sp. GAS368]|uniref:glutamate--tRNA ligase n=1 Tax=Opitutus sp. GAS368 TaxID=1882749 RepID=UPI00087AE0B4|nr:glutamate--tRNA ligase family protein [Opitutus sp. GAS368]SDS51194.1 glutamyl-tRNA synthetase [Opitutus sp. GAS368]